MSASTHTLRTSAFFIHSSIRDETASKFLASVVVADVDLIEQELRRLARTAPAPRSENVADDESVHLRHPMQNVRVGEIASSCGMRERGTSPSAAGNVEG